MKKYIALKAAKFDRKYQKGEEIPEGVIAPKMITKLERCGCIAIKEVEQEKEQEEESEKELLQYKKEELEHMAAQKGIEITQGMTKTDIVALLLQKE